MYPFRPALLTKWTLDDCLLGACQAATPPGRAPAEGAKHFSLASTSTLGPTRQSPTRTFGLFLTHHPLYSSHHLFLGASILILTKMSYNDGSKLLVFGLSFAQQDSRKMQQVLGHYHKLPDNTSRAVLFTQLNALAKDLMAHETSQHDIPPITHWMQNGGDFPASLGVVPSTSTTATPTSQATHRATAPRRYQYQYRYGQGRTLNGSAEEAAADGDGYDDEDDDMEDEEFDEMDRLPRWQTGSRALFFGPGHQLEEPETLQHEEGYRAIEAGNRHDTSNQDTDTTNDQNETHEDRRANDTADVNRQDTKLEEPSPAAAAPAGPSGTHDPDIEAEDQIVECPICAEEYPTVKFPRDAIITEACAHPEKACLDCLESSIAAVVERGALHLLACPICPAKLTSRNVEQYASSQVYERYKYLKEQSEIPGHYTSCMNPKCGGSQPHEGGDPRMICRYCNFATCAHHRRPWHEGQTCSEFDLDDAQLERLEEEEATAKLLSKEDTSICPKCGQGVTKTEGCDHMNCTCGEEWCYICSCSYENVLRLGAIAHATFCIYHPNKVNLTKTQREAARDKIMGLVHGGEVSAELAKARDELRERRRAEIRPKVAEAAEARRKLAMQQERESRAGRADDKLHKKKKVKLVAPWEEGGTTKRAF